MHLDEIFRIGKYLLPSEYSPVEYIGFDGSSYLDLAPLTTESDIEITFQKTATSTAFMFGINPTGSQSGIVGAWVNNTSLVVQNGNVRQTITIDANWHTLKATSTKTILDGVEYDAGSRSSLDYQNLVIGGARDQTSSVVDNRMFKGDISHVKVGNTIFIPVKDVVNNTFGLLDPATNTFYGNAGTGTITGGNEIPTDEFKTIGSGNNKIWERAVPTTTAKGALATMTPTRVVRNLLPTPAANTERGVTVTRVDGGIRITGTSNADVMMELCRFNLPAGTYTCQLNPSAGLPSTGGNIQITASGLATSFVFNGELNQTITRTATADSEATFKIRLVNGDTYDITLYPMLVEGSTAKPFYPYFAPQTVLPHVKVFGKTVKRHISLNLFDKTAITTGKYLDSTGAEVSNTGWNISDYMPVESGATYYQTINTTGSAPKTCWYATDKTFLSATAQVAGGTLTAPTNAAYCRMCVFNSGLDTAMFTKGSTAPTGYIPYGIYELYGVGEKTEQLYDKTQAVLGDIRSADGAINPLGYRIVSGFIPVNEGDTISSEGTLHTTDGTVGISFSRIKAFYDADKAFITGSRSATGASLEIPEGVKYVRLEFYTSNIDNTKTCDIERSIINIVKGTTTPSAAVPIPYGYAVNILLGSQGLVDLGTLSWAQGSVAGRYYTDSLSTVIKSNASSLTTQPLYCSKYRMEYVNEDKVGYLANTRVVVNDVAYATAADFKAAVSGVMLYYQRATDATWQPPTPYTFYTDRQLNAISTYEDILTSNNDGTGQISGAIGAKVLTGMENWTKETTHWRFTIEGREQTKSEVFCSHYEYSSQASGSAPDFSIFTFTSSFVGIKDSRFDSLAEWKAYLAAEYAAGHPVVIYYPLATPVTTQLTGLPIISLTEKAQYTLENTNTVKGNVQAEYLGA